MSSRQPFLRPPVTSVDTRDPLYDPRDNVPERRASGMSWAQIALLLCTCVSVGLIIAVLVLLPHLSSGPAHPPAPPSFNMSDLYPPLLEMGAPGPAPTIALADAPAFSCDAFVTNLCNGAPDGCPALVELTYGLCVEGTPTSAAQYNGPVAACLCELPASSVSSVGVFAPPEPEVAAGSVYNLGFTLVEPDLLDLLEPSSSALVTGNADAAAPVQAMARLAPHLPARLVTLSTSALFTRSGGDDRVLVRRVYDDEDDDGWSCAKSRRECGSGALLEHIRRAVCKAGWIPDRYTRCICPPVASPPPPRQPIPAMPPSPPVAACPRNISYPFLAGQTQNIGAVTITQTGEWTFTVSIALNSSRLRSVAIYAGSALAQSNAPGQFSPTLALAPAPAGWTAYALRIVVQPNTAPALPNFAYLTPANAPVTPSQWNSVGPGAWPRPRIACNGTLFFIVHATVGTSEHNTESAYALGSVPFTQAQFGNNKWGWSIARRVCCNEKIGRAHV